MTLYFKYETGQSEMLSSMNEDIKDIDKHLTNTLKGCFMGEAPLVFIGLHSSLDAMTQGLF